MVSARRAASTAVAIVTTRVREVTTTIVDLPISRRHGLGVSTLSNQSSVIVQVLTESGLRGLGEAVVPGGGPHWGGESVESMKVTIDHYLAPALIGEDLRGPNEANARLQRASAGNHFAKAALEMAMWDIAGREAGVPIHQMFGGVVRDAIPVLWSVGGNVEDPMPEIEQAIADGHRTIKFMMGQRAPKADVQRVLGCVGEIPRDVMIIVDANGKWDASTAARLLPALAEARVDIAEQLVAPWDLAGLSRLTGLTAVWTMADEAVRSIYDAAQIGAQRAVDAVAVKVPKLGGIGPARVAASVVRTHGLHVYAGGTMETSIGVAAGAHVFATVPALIGSDLGIGPQLLTDDVVTERVPVSNGSLVVPTGPGLGVDLDEDKLKQYGRND
jgi:muconate cycloisomerase